MQKNVINLFIIQFSSFLIHNNFVILQTNMLAKYEIQNLYHHNIAVSDDCC